jgi:hypothetical protein
MKKLFLASLACLVLTLALAVQGFGVSNIVQSITYSPQVQGFIALIKGDSSRVIEAKPKQYIAGQTYNGVALTVTGSNSFVLSRGVLIPYRTSDGAWRLRFNIGSSGSTASATHSVTIAGIVFHAGYTQATSCLTTSGGLSMVASYTSANGNSVNCISSAAYMAPTYSGDAELVSKPTWAD